MKRPNFFIVGAPKCGTTSLSEYLKTHPQVFFSFPKEPHYFAAELSPRFRRFDSEQTYLRECFGGAGQKHHAVGEGSTLYLRSPVAARLIRQFNPDARIIAMFRNPADLAYSFHSQVVFSLDEDVADFRTAWRLQDQRRSGRAIPKTCRTPEFLQYRELAMLGRQLQRLYEALPREQVLTILFEDFVADTAKVYAEVLAFLGLAHDGRSEFPPINENRRHRSGLIGRLLFTPPRWMYDGVQWVKKRLGLKRTGVVDLLLWVNAEKRQRPPLDADLRAELIETFRQDILTLQELLGRDLGHWLTQPVPAAT